MSVSIVDQSTGNTSKIAGNINDKIGNLSSLITTDKSSVVAAINELGGGVNEIRNSLTSLNSKRIEIETIADDNVIKTVTFSGTGHTRLVNMLLVPASQSVVAAPISIMFGGILGYQSISGVHVSANDAGVTANGFTITLPVQSGGWGVYTLIKLYPDDAITYVVERAS